MCDDDCEWARQQVEDGLTASSWAADILKGLTKDKPSKGQGETEDDGSRRWRRHGERKNIEGVEKGKKAILSTGVERDEKMQHPRQWSSQERPLLPATWWEAPTTLTLAWHTQRNLHPKPGPGRAPQSQFFASERFQLLEQIGQRPSLGLLGCLLAALTLTQPSSRAIFSTRTHL